MLLRSRNIRRLVSLALGITVASLLYTCGRVLYKTKIDAQRLIIKEASALNQEINSKDANLTLNNEYVHLKHSERGSNVKSQFVPSTEEVHHVVYLKSHKTGSSTVQNIFLRFVDSRNLTMVFPHTPDHPLAEASCSNVISYRRTILETNIVPPPHGRHYDVLCCHVVFNEDSFKTYMPQDTVYIGLVREPFKRLESAMQFFALFRNNNASEFANDPFRFDRRLPSHSNNRMAFEMGFPLKLFPNKNVSKPDSVEVQSYLETIHKQFDLILINERMEESLVYMRRLLGWKLEDIIYMKQKVTRRLKRRFTKEDKAKLADYLFLDMALYNYSMKEFDSKFNSLGQDAVDEVTFYKDILQKVIEFCITKTMNNIVIPETKWSGMFIITREKCKAYTLLEQSFVQRLRVKTYGTENN